MKQDGGFLPSKKPKVTYYIEPREKKEGPTIYAIIRVGPRGGERVVGVWDNEYAVDRIIRSLKIHALEEVTGNANAGT